MLWFTIHHLVQNIVSAEDQTKNLITFLSGTVIYTLFYAYLGTFDFSVNLFLKGIFNFFGYVVLADAFAMAVIYKNYYKQTIFTEVKETMGSNLPYVDKEKMQKEEEAIDDAVKGLSKYTVKNKIFCE